MSNRLTDEKVQAIAQNYCTNGYKKGQALKDAGCSKSYSEHNGLKLFDNDRVKAEIKRIQAKIATKSEWNTKALTDKYSAIGTASLAVGDRTAALRAYENISKHIGYYDADNSQKATKQAIQVNIDTSESLQQAIDKLNGIKEARKVRQVRCNEAEDAICTG